MRLSIISTLSEAFALWMRHWRYFVSLAFFLGSLTYLDHRSMTMGPAKAILDLAGLILPIVFPAIGMAAFLNRVAHPSAEMPWLNMVRGVQRFTGRIVRVQVLLILVGAIPIVFFVLLFHNVLGLGGFWTTTALGLLLILLKFALASPLAVAEDLAAADALEDSWRMTRRRFGYVFGCFLVFGVLETAINQTAGLFAALARIEHLDPKPGLSFVGQFLGTFWYVLPWIMYLRIKEANAVPIPGAEVFRPAIDAPPEGV